MSPLERREGVNHANTYYRVVRPAETKFSRHRHEIMHRDFSTAERVAMGTIIAAIGLFTIAYITLHGSSSEPPQSAPAAGLVPVAQAATEENDPNVEVIVRQTKIFQGTLTLYPGIRFRKTTIADANTNANNIIRITPVDDDKELIVENPEIELGGSATPWKENEYWATHIPVKNIADEKVEASVNLGEQTKGYVSLTPSDKAKRGYQDVVLIRRGYDQFFKTENGETVPFTKVTLGKREPKGAIAPQVSPTREIVK